jgi:uncharacterized membrane protein YeaQ/YmgE (transglycosylase-associated protein family)
MMLHMDGTTLLLYVLLGSIIGWFARALYDLKKQEPARKNVCNHPY